MPNLITWDIDNNILDLSALDTSLQDKLTVPVPSQQTFRIGFYRGGSGDTRRYLDLGADPSIEFIVKPSTGNNRFDVAPVVASPTFTRLAADDLGDYYYEASFDFTAPVFLKALGVETGFVGEVFRITPTDNAEGKLFGRYFDIYYSPTLYKRFWFDTSPTSVTPPSIGGANALVRVEIASDDDASTVAAAIETAFSVIPVFSIATTAYDVDIEYYAGAVGNHDPQNSGVTISVSTAGSAPGDRTDVTSVQYNGQLVYLDGTAPQISPLFTLEIVNSLYRDGQIYPSGISSNYREGSVTLSTTDSATVTFSSALSASTYDIISLEVIYIGAGSPGLKLSPQTIDDKATTGFTVYLNGDATSSYRLDYKVTL